MEHVNAYFEKIYSPTTDCSVYITQSWINYTEEKQRHHIHLHGNSLISGVLYINADIDFDSITFYKRELIKLYKYSRKNGMNLMLLNGIFQ